MKNKKIQDAINGQINAELYSSYFYLSMAAYLDSKKMKGFANWMRAQAAEELTHAMKMYNYVNDQNGRVTMKPIDGPPTEWSTPLELFEDVYKHEVKVTGLINGLVALAKQENDQTTYDFLQWFVEEQEEEEESAEKVVNKLKQVGNDKEGLIKLDNELGQRKLKFTTE